MLKVCHHWIGLNFLGLHRRTKTDITVFLLTFVTINSTFTLSIHPLNPSIPAGSVSQCYRVLAPPPQPVHPCTYGSLECSACSSSPSYGCTVYPVYPVYYTVYNIHPRNFSCPHLLPTSLSPPTICTAPVFTVPACSVSIQTLLLFYDSNPCILKRAIISPNHAKS